MLSYIVCQAICVHSYNVCCDFCTFQLHNSRLDPQYQSEDICIFRIKKLRRKDNKTVQSNSKPKSKITIQPSKKPKLDSKSHRGSTKTNTSKSSSTKWSKTYRLIEDSAILSELIVVIASCYAHFWSEWCWRNKHNSCDTQIKSMTKYPTLSAKGVIYFVTATISCSSSVIQQLQNLNQVDNTVISELLI